MNNKKSEGVLSDIKIIDLTRVLGGPFCTQWFGDFGADVIKIEPPQGDETRHWGPPFDDNGTASYFLGVNRSKRGMSLDLRTEKGREILLRLLEDADVLIENFKVGTLNRWGLDYDSVLKDRFPGLIHCRISGFGKEGPLGGFPGYDAIVQAIGGWMSVNGSPESGPTRVGIPMVDIGTGMSSAFGIMVALHERENSGLGQFIDMSLYDTALSLLFPHAANWFIGNKRPQLTGNQHPNIFPYDTFSTQTCEIFIGVGNDGQFGRLCKVLGKPQLAQDKRFITNEDRCQNRFLLRGELEQLLSEHDGEKICSALMRNAVPAGPVLDVPEALGHDHAKIRKMVVELEGYKGLGNPVKLTRTPPHPERTPPGFGQDTRSILAEIGCDNREIEDLISAEVVKDKNSA